MLNTEVVQRMGLPTQAAGVDDRSGGGGAQPGQPLSQPTCHTDFSEVTIAHNKL